MKLAKVRLAVTVDEELYEKIVEQAKEENRNLSNYVETLLYRVVEVQND